MTKIEDPELEHICAELGLADSLVPMHMVGHYRADMAEGQNIIELSDILRGDARVFSFPVTEAEAVRISELALPKSERASRIGTMTASAIGIRIRPMTNAMS